jgi:hypothetical protein
MICRHLMLAILLCWLFLAPSVASPSTTTTTSAPTITSTTPVTETPLKRQSFFDFYAANLRSSLFSGCLTLGSFLLAMNTFIVVNLKKEVYEHKRYVEIVRGIRKGNPRATFYGPLKRLSTFLLYTITVSFVTAISQLTLGVLITHWIAATICLSLAALTMILLLITLCLIRANLLDWFKYLEEQAVIDEKNLPK